MIADENNFKGFEASLKLEDLNGANGFKIKGIGGGNLTGFSVSDAGDINGDGFGDLVIGAPANETITSGRSYVVFGNSTGFPESLALSNLDGSNGFSIIGVPSLLGRSGWSVSGLGDVNGDGLDDLIIGTPRVNFFNGESYIVFGRRNGFESSLDLSTLDNNTGLTIKDDISSFRSNSSFSVSGAGDINGDGIQDIAIGSLVLTESRDRLFFRNLTAKDPETYIVFGRKNGFTSDLNLKDLNGQNGFKIITGTKSFPLSYTVSDLGDFNGDGVDDLLIGAGKNSNSNQDSVGKVYVIFGRKTGFANSLALSALNGQNGFMIDANDVFDNSRISVSGAGDINGDNLSDLIIGVPSASGSVGKTYVVFGRSSGFSNSLDILNLDGQNGFTIDGAKVGDALGYSVSRAGDINNDGIDDLIVGAVGANPDGNSNSAGESYVVFGKRSGFTANLELANLNGDNGFKIEGINSFDQSGFSVSAAGDVNGDGIDDLVIGAPNADVNGNEDVGESYVIFGRDSQPPVPLSSFIGSEIQLQHFFPNLDTDIGVPVTATVDNGVEFDLASYAPNPEDPGFISGYKIDISETSIIYTAVDAPINNPFYNNADFNGIVFSDVTGQLPEITNVAIDPTKTTLTIDDSDITFTEDSIAINFEGISYQPGETIKLDVSFAGLDLVVDSVSTSVTEAELGDRINVDWTVSNQGTVSTTTGWSDRIYLSIDNTLSSDDIALGSLPAQKTQLAPGESYSQTLSVDLPIIDGLTDGTYQILVKTDDGGGQAETLEANNVGTTSLSVSTPEFALNGIKTSRGSNLGTTTITVLGSQFTPDATVRLIAPDGAIVSATSVQWHDSTELWATFDLQALTLGKYDVNVQQPGDGSVTLADRFTVTDGPLGNLDVEILTTPTIRSDREGIVTVVYTNTGDTDLVAPLLQIDADNASLKDLDDDVFTEDPIQKLGINPNGPIAVLSPGAQGSFSFKFDPLTEAGTDIDFTVSTLTADTTINWDDIRDEAQPSYLSDAAWDPVWNNFISGVEDSNGATTDSYVGTLAENATYLDQLGEKVTGDVDQLIAFELQQASSYQALPQRYSLGAFGRGGSFIGDLKLVTDSDGNVSLENGGLRRSFELQSNGLYVGADEDDAVLTLTGSVYRLEEEDGTVTVFLPDGSLNYVEDTNGNRVTASYTNNLLTGLTSTSGDSLTFDYNSQGRIVRASNQSGQEVTYGYDVTGELLTRLTTPTGTTEYSYDSNFNVTGITDANGTAVTFAYDDQGRLVQESLNNGTETVTYAYDSTGGITVTDANGVQTQVLLNDRGQVGQLTDPLGRTLGVSYDHDGNATKITGPDGRSTYLTYDAEGNLISQLNPLKQRIDFTYEPNYDLLESVTDARGNALNYTYDSQGNLTAITYADNSQETFDYDSQGNVLQTVNRRGQDIDYTYNSRGQLLSQTNSDGTTQSYTYDDRGNLLTATNGTGTIAMEYDTADRLTKITYPNGRSLAYEYDAGGRRTRMEDHDGNIVNYSYDAAGRLAGLTDGAGTAIVSYSYDAVGRLAQERNGNGTVTTYSYDDAGQLLNIVNAAPNGLINSREDYTYDVLGQQTRVSTLDGTWDYTYDATGQLIGAVFASTNPSIPNQDLTYVYDAAGNRIQTIVNGETTDYNTNNLNQYTSAGDAVYSYDDDGNLISKTENGETWSYSYDTENRLVGVVEPDGSTTQYEYDALGNRIATVYNGERTEYLVDPFGFGDVVGEYGDSGNPVQYTHGIGLVSRTNAADGTAFYDSNLVGSTVGITGDSGDYLNRYSYRPFGQEISETETIANPFEFVGQWGVIEEANGLEFMRARLYETNLGRFLNPDPIGLQGGVINLYSYSLNSPNSIIDPSGNIVWFVVFGLVAEDLLLNPNVANDYYNTSPPTPPGFGIITGVGGKFVQGTGKTIINKVKPKLNQKTQKFLNRNEKWIDKGLEKAGSKGAERALKSLQNKNDNDSLFSDDDLLFLDNVENNILKFQKEYYRGNNFYKTQERVRRFIFAQDPRKILDQKPTRVVELPQQFQKPKVSERPNNSSKSKGEPHLTTFDGVGYSFQGAGEFTLVQSESGDLNVQIRYVQIDPRATVASAVATMVDGQRVVIDSEGIQFDENGIPFVTRRTSGRAPSITIDGVEVNTEDSELATTGQLDIGNSRIYRRGGEYTIVFAGKNGTLEDGDDQLVVNYFRPGTLNIVSVYLGDEKKGQIEGLLGNLNDNPDDDVALADGTPLERPLRFTELYGDYREAWRIKEASESLFDYEPGQSPDTFYNPNFPVNPFSFNDLDPVDQARGEAAALAAGYTPGTFEFFSAAFDFAITNDPGFLEGNTEPQVTAPLSIIDDRPDPTTQLSSIEGLVFDDANGNSIRDAVETGLAGVTIFLDENQNGQLDPNEQSKVTKSSGEYGFTEVPAGNYDIRQITPSGYEQTYPFSEIPTGDGFADKVLDYFDSGAGPKPGPYGIRGSEAEVDVTVDVVLGNDPSTALSLPTGSSVTVSFEDEVIVNGLGDDIFIGEKGAASEKAEVYVSSDLTTFSLLGIADGGKTTRLDLESIGFNEPVRSVKIVGLDNRGGSPGFDVASVQGLPDSIISPDFYTVSLQPGESLDSLNFGNRLVVDGSLI